MSTLKTPNLVPSQTTTLDNKSFPDMEIKYLSPNLIQENHYKSRQHSENKIKRLAKFMSVSRLICPLLLDKNNVIIAGHARLKAATLIGLQSVPVIQIEHLNQAMIRAFALADNQFCLNAGWDKKALKEEMVFLSSIVIDYGLELTDIGFDTPEIDIVIGDNEDGLEDMIHPDFSKKSISQLGDKWILGSHRLICGNSLDLENFKKVMGEDKASMVFTDPPYNVPINGHVCVNGSRKHKEFAMASGEMKPNEFIKFLSQIFELMKQFSQNGSIHFVCMDWRHILEIQSASINAGLETKNLCVWVKDNGGMGSLYRSKHELIFVYKSGASPHVNNVELGKHGRYRTNVWEYPGANSLKAERIDELSMHPTVKPVKMICDAIKDCSKIYSIILDPFGGSGSTLIAAEKTNRKARIIEIEPHYCDVIIRRWQNLTGKDATLEQSGCSFNSIELASQNLGESF